MSGIAFAMCSALAVTIAVSAADAGANRSPRDECLPGNIPQSVVCRESTKDEGKKLEKRV